MKLVIFILIVVIIYTIYLKYNKKDKNKQLQINLKKYSEYKTLEFNTYGEIKGLGMKYEKYEFDSEVLNEFIETMHTYNNWKKLPLTKNLKVLLEDYILSSSANAEDSSKFKGYINIPPYVKGYYYFIDKNKNRENIDNTILHRQHLGFELFILNTDDKELNHIVMDI
ncbi:hypothetical protein [Miniphocaeibacter halophilus]|uniref:Uncharacterized protein n=1 Tax=Miniphocaeibacter halophilus TaxID=2931922 RepID=A0AC61MRK3_9FIRM|nr:hypothetical protein [Miniphocaeibacter halophilus]QQK08199.1 hypothetical protein JFY71_01290 [Miniphocaeibacter halophilus]